MVGLPGETVIMREAIGISVGRKVKIAAGLFWLTTAHWAPK